MKPPPAHALVNQLVALTLGLLVFGGTLGLAAVWVRQEIFSTANRSRVLDLKLADVQRRLDEINAEVATALNPDTLLTRNAAMGLELVAPKEPQVVRIDESPELRLAAKHNREIFTFAAGAAAATATDAGTPGVSFRVVAASYH
jgi:hypothetical protein